MVLRGKHGLQPAAEASKREVGCRPERGCTTSDTRMQVVQNRKSMMNPCLVTALLLTRFFCRSSCWGSNEGMDGWKWKRPQGLQTYHVKALTKELDRARLWNHARKLLGMQVLDENQFNNEEQKNIARRFYLHCGLKSFLFMDGKALYLRIPKSGNDRTRCNLAKAPGKGWIVECPDKKIAQMYRKNGTSVFTVVRNPLSRFISGYTEVELRTLKNAQVQKGYSHHIGSTERVHEYLMRLLSGDDYIEVFHTFSQSWVSVPFAEIQAYKLEDNARGWDSLMMRLRISPGLKYSFQCGGHKSSLDPLRTTAAAKAELEKNANVTKALCTLFLPDFLNFQYSMPSVCRFDRQIDILARKLWA